MRSHCLGGSRAVLLVGLWLLVMWLPSFGPNVLPVRGQVPPAVWEPLIAGEPVRYVFVTRSGALYAMLARDLRRSDDNGASWTPVPLPPRAPETALGAAAVDPNDDPTIYAAGDVGIYRTTDAGATWELVLPTDGAAGIEVSPAAPGLLYAVLLGTRPQYLRSRDAGADWSALPSPAVASTGCTTYAPLLQPHPTDARRVFRVAACVNRASGGGPIEQSRDQGESWSPLLRPDPREATPGYPERLVGGEGAQPARFYLAASRRLPDASVWRLLRSDDDGATWRQLLAHRAASVPATLNIPWALAVDPRDPDRLWLGRSEHGGGVQTSRDGGETWTDAEPPTIGAVLHLALTADGSALFAATATGLWRLQTPAEP